jgi:chemotaxis protein methyltransferase CheR
MGAVVTSDNRYRSVVFPAAVSRRPLNFGAAGMHVSPRRVLAAYVDHRTGPDAFLTWLFLRAGLSADDYRPASLHRRLPACLRALRAANISEARRLLRRTPQLISVALDALLLGVTEFFRDAHVFSCLRDLLPSVISRNQGVLRIWSAGCSNGAELYSVASLLAELNVLDAIAGAATVGEGVAPGHRAHITWRRANVLGSAETGPWDIILCRNLAMYLQPAAARRLWRGLGLALRDGGLLIVGKAERPTGASGLVLVGPCVYRRFGEL